MGKQTSDFGIGHRELWCCTGARRSGGDDNLLCPICSRNPHSNYVGEYSGAGKTLRPSQCERHRQDQERAAWCHQTSASEIFGSEGSLATARTFCCGRSRVSSCRERRRGSVFGWKRGFTFPQKFGDSQENC